MPRSSLHIFFTIILLAFVGSGLIATYNRYIHTGPGELWCTMNGQESWRALNDKPMPGQFCYRVSVR